MLDLINTAPSKSTKEIANRPLMDSELISQFLLPISLGGEHTNFTNSLYGKLGIRELFARKISASTFFVHVVHVILMSPGEKMERIETASIVAAMKDAVARWNWTVDPFIDESMGKYLLLIASEANSRIAILVKSAMPLKANIHASLFRLACQFDKLLSDVVFFRLFFPRHNKNIKHFYVIGGA